MDHLTDVFTAMAHPSRRVIMARLAKGPARFSDVAEEFDTALNSVTKHLKLMERAGLIERTRKGREVFISLKPEPLREAAQWIHQYEQFWTQRLDDFAQHFKAKREKH